jgi:hypothetical protein
MSDNGRDFWDASIAMTPAAQKMHSPAAITSPYEGAPLEVTILVFCDNNETTIVPTLDTVVEAMGVVDKPFEIIVIDDCSKDRTAEMVRGYIAEFPKLRMLLRINKKKKGLAQNYFDGAFIGCGKYYRLVYGDNSEAVETMVDILKTLGEADIVVPYFVSMMRKSLWGRFTTGGYAWFVNIISGNRINGYSLLQVHLRYNVMRWRSCSMGAAFQTDLLCQLLDLGFTCKQVPCRAVPQRARIGKRKALRNAISTAHTLLEILLRRISGSVQDR